MTTIRKRLRESESRGAAVVEFAIAIPLFVALLLLVFDAGLGYSASRSSSSAARTAARVGALAGDARDADYKVLEALRSFYGDADSADTFIVYVSDPLNANGTPPPGCASSSIVGVCNRYDASILNSLDPSMFATTTLPDGTEICDPSAPDAAWCPLTRRLNDGQFLGVYVSSNYDTTTGLETDAFDLEDRSVFALYFPPEPVAVAGDGSLLDDVLDGVDDLLGGG